MPRNRIKIMLSLLLILSCAVVFYPGGLKAQPENGPENSTTSSPEDNTPTTSSKDLTETPESAPNKTEAVKKIDGESKDVIQARVWRIVKRFQAAMNRLANISQRMESRLSKMEERGASPEKANSAREDISKAKKHISSAGDKIILAAAEIKQVFKNTPPSQAFEEFRDYTQESKKDIKRSMENLRSALEKMKEIQDKLRNG